MNSADRTPDTPGEVAQEEPRRRWTGLGGAAFLLAGVAMPVGCFVLAQEFGPEWQSGATSDYAMLLLSWRPSSAFYPLLLYSMASMTLLVFSFDRGAKVFVVRLGIYTGVLLAVQYFCLVAMAEPGVAIVGMIIALVLWGFSWLFYRLLSSRNPLSPAEGDVADAWSLLASLVLLVLISGGVFLLAFPVILVLACAACGPPWTVFAYSAMANRLVRERRVGQWQFSLAQLLGVMAWFAAWFGAWRLSIQVMLDEYSKLPTSAPGCYVSTAAARGHRRWVRSEEVVGPAGVVCRINDQLRYLKAFELVWARVAPRGHRLCRRCYDRLGPAAAAMLVHPLLADLAYAALKPAEWTARAALAALVPRGGERARRLYRR